MLAEIYQIWAENARWDYMKNIRKKVDNTDCKI